MKKEKTVEENASEKETLIQEETKHIEDKIEEHKEDEIKEVNSEKETVENKEKSGKVEELENKQKANKEKQEIKEAGKHADKKEKSLKTVIFIIILIIFLLFSSTIFAILNVNNSNIIKGVYIEEVDASNLDKETLKNMVNDKVNNIEDVEVRYGEYNSIFKLEEIGININYKDIVNDALKIGRTDNIIIDNFNILKANLFKTKLKLDITIDSEKLKEAIKNIQAEIPEAIKEYSYDIKDKELIITNGKSGQKVITEKFKDMIIQNIRQQFNGKVQVINIPTEVSKPEKINIEKIYSEIYKEAKDAYIIEEPFELHKEENGVDFAIRIEEARKIISEEKEAYTIPLKITEPKVKIEDLGDKLFKQTLSKYTTIFDAGVKNRAHNIALAAKTINGTILLPGETFSYNGILGNTNKEKGYKLGTAYVAGKVVESYGGGICQVSSTLYNSVLYANLEIVERYNHSYVVNYVPAGRDATVAYGGKDFKFKNSRNYPIKIVASAKNGVVSISIMGIKEEKEYEVVLTSTVLSTTKRSVVYQNNKSLEEGKQKIIQKGYDGKKSIAYKILKYNGKTISKTVLSKDTYKPMNQIIEVGTKKVTTQTTNQTNNNTNI